MTEETSNEFVCVLPFLNSDPMFARGVEIGVLWKNLCELKNLPLCGYYHTENEDQILLMCSRLNIKTTLGDIAEGGWRWIDFT